MEQKLYLLDLLDLTGKTVRLVSVVGTLQGLLDLAGKAVRLVSCVRYLNLRGL